MPTSQHRQISSILDLVTHLHPRSVLDVGIGVGTYGFLCAMIGDQHRLLPGYEPSPEFRLDGIEGFSDYVGPIQRAIYKGAAAFASERDAEGLRTPPAGSGGPQGGQH